MSLAVYQNTIVNDRGDVLPNALLRVRTDPGQGTVTLYKDRDGFDVLTNVGDVYADDDGFVRFYLPPGVYRLHIVASGYERTYRHVHVAPLNEYNVVAAEQYTLKIADAGNSVQFISNNSVSVEIPTDEEVEFPMWAETTLIQAGDGIITLSGDVTIQNPSGGPVKSMGKGSSIKLTLIGGNVWLARVEFDRVIKGDIEQTGDLKITGNITHQGNSSQTGNSTQTGNAQITGRLDVDNLRLDGNIVSSTNTNGNVEITPHGTGKVRLNKNTDITGNVAHTGTHTTNGQLNVDNLRIDGNVLSSTNSNGHVDITPAGTGKVRLNKSTDVAGGFSVSGDAVFHGNLHVKGTATIIDSTEVDIGDNIIRLNAGETGQPTLSAGFEVERGLQANVSFLWDEFNKRWTTGTQKLHSGGFVGDGSEITNVRWGNVSGKPATATRWPIFEEVTDKPSTYPPSSHQHPASQISDSTSVGRAVLTAEDAAAARAAIGAAEEGAGGGGDFRVYGLGATGVTDVPWDDATETLFVFAQIGNRFYSGLHIQGNAERAVQLFGWNDVFEVRTKHGGSWQPRRTLFHDGNVGTVGRELLAAPTKVAAATAIGAALRLDANVTISVPTDFPTLQSAIDYCSRFTPAGNFRITIKLESGFVINDGAVVTGRDVSFVEIVADDPVVMCDLSASATENAILAEFGASGPTMSFSVDMQGTGRCGYTISRTSKGQIGTISIKNARDHGIDVTHNSDVWVEDGARIESPGRDGVHATHSSRCHARRIVIVTPGERGINANNCSNVNAQYATIGGGSLDALYASSGSVLNAAGATINGGGRIRVQNGGTIVVSDSTGATNLSPPGSNNAVTGAGIIYT